MTVSAQQLEFGGHAEGAVHRAALPPILIGLSAPVIVLVLIDSHALGSASLLVQLYVYALFVIATLLFIISVFEQGEVTRVTVEKPARRILIERTGMLARSVTELPFADIASVRMETRCDDDGYETTCPLIILTTRETIPMPVGTTESEIAMMRGLIKGN